MNDFKIGDELIMIRVYDDMNKNGQITAYLDSGIVSERENGHLGVVAKDGSLIEWLKYGCWYKSKSEAIDAMIVRLEELRDE